MPRRDGREGATRKPCHIVRLVVFGHEQAHADLEEVEAIRNALTAIEWPDEELAVFATLRGPMFAFTDAELLSYRTLCTTLHAFKQSPDDLPESLNEVAGALAILRELHSKRNRRPIAETLQQLLEVTRAFALRAALVDSARLPSESTANREIRRSRSTDWHDGHGGCSAVAPSNSSKLTDEPPTTRPPVRRNVAAGDSSPLSPH
jgi:hypothetical protein